MECIAAERGGPFGRNDTAPLNWMRAAAPGIATRCRPAESSPIGSGATAQRASVRWTSRARRAGLAALLAVVGLACFGNGMYIYAKAGLAQVLLHRAWYRTQVSGAPVKPWPWADMHPVARLTADAQGADVLVLSGASGRTLAFGPGHVDGSAAPGAPGNSVIVAHRDTHFRFLRRLAVGDVLAVEGRDGTQHRFQVRRAYVADFRALDIPRETPVPTLTLVTCYPFDAVTPGGPLRYVVVAEAA